MLFHLLNKVVQRGPPPWSALCTGLCHSDHPMHGKVTATQVSTDQAKGALAVSNSLEIGSKRCALWLHGKGMQQQKVSGRLGTSVGDSP